MDHVEQASWGQVEVSLQKSFACYYHSSQDKADAAVTCYMDVLKTKGMKGFSVHQVGVLAGAMVAKNTMNPSQIRVAHALFLKSIDVAPQKVAGRQTTLGSIKKIGLVQ